MQTRIRYRLEYAAMKLLLVPLRVIPHRWSVAIGGWFGGLIWRLGIRREVSRFNLKLCLPEFTGNDADAILAESYRNFVRSMVEFALLPRIKGRTNDFIRFEGLDKAMEILDSDRGCLLVTGHFGSWELLGAALCEAGLPLDFLVGEQSNGAVDDFINGIRSEMGIGIIHMGVAARGVLKSVRHGRAVAMLSDQDAGKSSTIVDFFGHPAATPGGIAAFSLKLKCPIIVGGIVRRGKSPVHDVLVEVLEPDYDAMPKDKNEAVRRLTQLYTDRIEHYIRKHPRMYFWAHRRFKRTIPYPE